MCDIEFKDQLSLETRADAWGVWEGTTEGTTVTLHPAWKAGRAAFFVINPA